MMDGAQSTTGEREFRASSMYKVCALFTIVVIALEVYAVQRWESTSFSNPFSYKTKSETAGSSDQNDWQESTSSPVTSSYKTQSEVNGSTNNFNDSKQYQAKTKVNYAVRKYLELEDQLKARLQKATKKRIILVWVPMFGVKRPIKVDRKNCGNCEVVYDRSKESDDQTGALVFHFDKLNENNMPKNRNPKHLHIYWALESSSVLKVVRGHNLQFENKYQFNDTMTYRRDSGIYMGYDHKNVIDTIMKSQKVTPESLLQHKEKLAVAIVSNCDYTPGARSRILMLRELKSQGLALDGFGGCFPGGRSIANGKDRSSTEFHDAVRKYKFYFAFENSFHCKDYVSEKFFNNAIASFAVPVVWGANKQDYEAVAPPGSFIFVADFSSMKELADYLNYLDSNDTAYMQYFRWLTMKPWEMPQYGRAGGYCQICRVLHGINIDDIYSPKFSESNLTRPLFSDGVTPRNVSNLTGWIYGEDNKECFNIEVQVEK